MAADGARSFHGAGDTSHPLRAAILNRRVTHFFQDWADATVAEARAVGGAEEADE